MNDLISRQAAIDVLIAEGRNVDSRYLESERIIHELDAVEAIAMLPSAQPELIRCKDCKHSRFFDPCFYCYERGEEIIVPENGFCFMAERRDDEHID